MTANRMGLPFTSEIYHYWFYILGIHKIKELFLTPLPGEMSSRFYLDSEWRVKYNAIALAEMSLTQLKETAIAFNVSSIGKQKSKVSWLQPIVEVLEASLATLECWSDADVSRPQPL